MEKEFENTRNAVFKVWNDTRTFTTLYMGIVFIYTI